MKLIRRGDDLTLAREYYVGPVRILWWTGRGLAQGPLPSMGTLYGRGFMIWWGRLWIEVG